MHEHCAGDTHEHSAVGMERHCDVAVIGGSAAGLGAALQLARQKRGVIVIDDATPRNAPAAHMHGYLGRESVPPSELIAIGREEVRSYGVEVLDARAVSVTRTDTDGFRVDITGGHTVFARRVLAATGLIDELPPIDGLAGHWGRNVVHCPFCHGYEFRDRRIVQVVTSQAALHVTGLWRQLTDHLTVIVQEGIYIDTSAVADLRRVGVDVRTASLRSIVAGDGGELSAVELDDGTHLVADSVALVPRFSVRSEVFASLGVGLVAHESGLGDVIEVDSSGATAVPGLYAAGNVTDPALQALSAAAHGSRVGSTIALDLAAEDLRDPVGRSARATDWDRRYGPRQMWSGNPNGTLVNEVGGMVPGRALDVGAGEGGDAIWMAEQGWQVIAVDISRTALDRVEHESQRRRLQIGCHLADANAVDPFPAGGYELVTAAYASIPRTADLRAVHSLLEAVRPGGTLLIIDHDRDAMRSSQPGVPRPFDPDAYVSTSDFADVLNTSSDWTIETHDKRPRPPGAATAAHHMDDVVLRARRGPSADRIADGA